MDRLVEPDVKELNLFFTKGQKSSTTFNLSNLMHTMSIAVSLSTTTDPSLFTLPTPLSILPPLSTATFHLHLNPSDHPPLSSPPATLLVRSTMLPTGKAPHHQLRRLFSKPGPHVFKDAALPISLVGPHVLHSLLPLPPSLENTFFFSKAIPFCENSDLDSILISSILCKNSHFISALIEAGADPNTINSDGQSVMSLAIKSGDIDLIHALIQSGGLIQYTIDRSLHEAAEIQRLDIIKVLCSGSKGLIDVNSTDLNGQTPLHIATTKNNAEMVQFLISIGAEPEIADSNGCTALHYSASNGDLKMVELLFNSSLYSKHAISKDGKTAFTMAVEKGHCQLYDLLQLGDVLHRAARLGDVEGMRRCIAEGGDVNGRDQNGWTPLHRAAFKGRVEGVKVLLGHGAQVELVDGSGYTALHRAVEAGHVQVALFLIAHGAKASVKSLKGVVPFNLDCFKNHPALVTPLCEDTRPGTIV